MKKLFRLFLLCVLMLAVPMQAALAASRICCATQHAQTSGEHLHVHHADESSHKAKATLKATIDHDASGEECCVAAAILNTLLSTASARPASEKISLIFSSCAGHIGDGPDKPPRF